MTKLEKALAARDRRRARKLVYKDVPHLATKGDFVPLIAAALARERKEARELPPGGMDVGLGFGIQQGHRTGRQLR